MISKVTIIILLCLFFSANKSYKIHLQTTGIKLREEKLNFIPAEFYISAILDHREGKEAIACLIPPFKKNRKTPQQVANNFEGGDFQAIKHFIENALPHNKQKHPIQILLNKFNLSETITANGRIKGEAFLNFSFSLQLTTGDTKHLSEYSSSSTYYRNPENPIDIEPILRQLLKNGLIFVNNWMNDQSPGNILLAKNVKLSFVDFTESPELDTIYYDVKRSLKWSDFQSKTASSKYEALVFTSFGYNEQVSVKNGSIQIMLVMKVYTPKSACWVKNGGGDNYSLNHEQRHFDIDKIVSERFIQQLKKEILPVDNYDGLINEDYFEALRDLHSLQTQYDDGTRHGLDVTAQKEWNTKIDKWLLDFNIRKTE